ncbi:murein biosynthesis integral membrane protein MurJ [Komagataeibacter sp. AV436]|uniref:Probable lipid II flippase MurJ n=1 Tax=Komagataeibacter melomenusus TaxID=2766578 RepID=A0ABX2AGE3_9PROT|nr:murein biosynthesis integral membrane protein MurJ [Komagataeibacter melomenusus]MBV1831744.1 murein biosynthesis integral membrane protein MurJ [Komagataeibacter melomenusus]NPC67451.1 murein biosynthesis integral membrane protein MurJ [Komagataeibacter melomenusus]
MLKGFLTVSGWTMISRVLGLVRDQLLAALLGTGAAQDAYQIAFRLPNMFRRLFGEGALNAAFVPLFASLLEREGKDTARQFASETMSVLLSWLLLLTVLGEIFMPGVLRVIAPGFAHGDVRDSLAISLSRITFPYLLMICGAALVSGVLNGMHRFGVAAAAYVSFNVVGIAAIVLLPPFTGDVAHAAAWGVSASGVVQFGILLYAAARAGMRLRLVMPCLTPRIRTLLARMGVGLVGSGITQINFLVDTIIATLLPAGSVSLMYFADRVNQLPLGVLGAAAGTTLLPVLTRHLAADDEAGAHGVQNRAISYALILTLPAAAGLLVLAAPVMMALFGHGQFTAHDAVLAAQSLRAYALGLPAFVLVKVLSPGFFARGDTRTPVLVGMGTLALNFILNISFMHWLAHIGPPLASSLAAMVNAGVLAFILLRRGALVPDPGLLRQLAGMVGCAGLMAGGVALLGYTPLGHAMTAGPLMRIVDVGMLIGLGVGLYLVALHGLGVTDLRLALGAVKRRLGRKRQA